MTRYHPTRGRSDDRVWRARGRRLAGFTLGRFPWCQL